MTDKPKKPYKASTIMILGAIPVILIGATADWYFLTLHSWINYAFICAWEYSIFWVGIYCGRQLKWNFEKEKQ